MDFNNPECCTCLEDYSRQKMPVVLPCGHAICESCFELLKVGDYIICPQDKIESYAKKLAPAYDMIFLIEQHTNLKKHLHEQKLLFEKICEENNKKMLDAIEIAKASGIQQMVGQLEIIQSENERNFNSQIEEIRKNESEKSQILIEEIKLMEKEKRNIDLEKIKHSYLNKINEEMKCFTEKHFKNLRRKMKNGKIRLENFQEIDYNNYRDRELRNDNRIY